MDSEEAALACEQIRADRLAAEHAATKHAAAVRTLEALGYVWKGGELWKPPLGMSPEAAERCRPRFATYPPDTFAREPDPVG
jgi:hypothetical protein